MEEQTAFLQRRSGRNEYENIRSMTGRVASGCRADFKSCLFELPCRSRHMPGVSDEGNTADPVLLQYCKALIGIFPGVARNSFDPFYRNRESPFPAPLSFVPPQRSHGPGGVATRGQYWFTGLPMQPRGIADALQAEASHSIAAIFRRVIVGAAPSTTMAWVVFIQGIAAWGRLQCLQQCVGHERDGQQVKQSQRGRRP